LELFGILLYHRFAFRKNNSDISLDSTTQNLKSNS